MSEELKAIKKTYGENMAHLCRNLFSTMLEKEGVLLNLLKEHFNESRELYNDLVSQGKEEAFKNYIYSFVDVENGMKVETSKSPEELLSEAGYELYECETEEDIQHFEKYYAKGEKLCTFHGGRLNTCRVFFAVKKDVDSIRREDFDKPARQDLYGTSVISIQFSRGEDSTVSIKNRYNHKVNNPDATFNNNLDLIIPGLTRSFSREYNLNIIYSDSRFELNGYVRANDGKYYKYNFERNNVYYCPGNIIIDNFDVKRYDLGTHLVVDNFIFEIHKETKLEDGKKKHEKSYSVKSYKEGDDEEFVNSLEDISNRSITDLDGEKELKISFKDSSKEPVIIRVDRLGNMIGLNHPNLKSVGDYFLYNSENLIDFVASNLEEAGKGLLYNNVALKKFDAPKLIRTGDNFLLYNEKLTELMTPSLKAIGTNSLCKNKLFQYLGEELSEFMDEGKSI